MSRPQLSSETRTDFSKSNTKKIRREGGIPATIYSKGEESKAVAVNAMEVAQILKAGGRLSLIDMKVDGKVQKAHPVMFQAIQRNPISNQILHIDFHRVSMNEPIHAKVPIVTTGEAPGVKLGGILEIMVNEVEVKALPDHVPSAITIDVSNMDIGNMVHIGDLSIPEGVEITHPTGDIAVVSVRPPAIHAPSAAEVEAAEAAEESATTEGEVSE